MSVKLRHIKGKSLASLEKSLEASKLPLVVLSVNKQGGEWYVHFLLQKDNDSPKSRVEIVEETKTIK